jgi:hypothetical protein
MGIDTIVNKISSVLEKIKPPIIPIPAFLLLCTLFNRPGASAMNVASNVIKRQSEFGAPTGVLPDGSPNKMNSLIYLIASEVFRELTENGVVEVAIPPSSLIITGTGANAGGPVVITGTNVTPTKAWGQMRCNK